MAPPSFCFASILALVRYGWDLVGRSRQIGRGPKIEAKQKEEPWLLPLSALPQFWPPEGYAWTLGTYAYKYAYVYT